MAFTVGRYGLGTLLSLTQLMLALCITCVLFATIVLGTVMRMSGLSPWKFVSYMKEELLVVFGTSTTEPVLPRLLESSKNSVVPRRWLDSSSRPATRSTSTVSASI